ncbi:urease accessory protein [Pseudoduganella lurida]|uniref:Urease accessory protein n=1 Tax=Pseudoduganella lurida TaxID=1036180 RepID=A0A562RKQ6_9BURK|nr:HupE/UreJ family protein [Pseudoduganella lurida]TWI69619.1 urease accessory protein [Pseudoduganella lurida]
MKKSVVTAVLLAAAAVAATPALAHPGHADTGLAAGMLHPLTGLDHLLAMLAAGIWSARQRVASGTPFRDPSLAQRLALPAAFLAMMGAGAAAGALGLQVPGLEGGIALTVLLMGVLIACAVRLPTWAGAAMLGVFAVLHGNAHGLELPQLTSAAGYLIGSALLLAGGRVLGKLPGARFAGAAIAAAGAGLLAL